MASTYLRSFLLIFAITSVKSKSFSIVLDVTGSMDVVIDVVRNNIPGIVRNLSNTTIFENFLVVPFTDSGNDDTYYISTKPIILSSALYDVTANGITDCPEDSLSGILKALEISKPESQIYVFTDAYAKTNRQLPDIKYLCKTTGSQVFIILSGSCQESSSSFNGDVKVYYDIAHACAGNVFNVNLITLRQIFRFVREMIKTDYKAVESLASFDGYKSFSLLVIPGMSLKATKGVSVLMYKAIFSGQAGNLSSAGSSYRSLGLNYQKEKPENLHVNSFATDILVTISAEYPVLHIVDRNGVHINFEKIFDAEFALVARVTNLVGGDYQLIASSNGLTYVTYYESNKLPFQYGFSTRMPYSLKETSLRPMPNVKNYVVIQLDEGYNIRVSSVELEFSPSDTKTLEMKEISNRKGLYAATVFIEDGKPFKMTIIGKELTTYKEVAGSTRLIEPQVQVNGHDQLPSTEIYVHDGNLINYGTSTTLSCKVIAFPKPAIWWEDENFNKLQSEDFQLIIPSTYLSYVTVENVKTNKTLSCKSSNKHGDSANSVQLFVKRSYSFDIKKSPEDTWIEYGASDKLLCEVEAYPEAEIKWYHNDSSVDKSDNLEVVSEESALLIKEMSLDDLGKYTCEVNNGIERRNLSADVYITGLVAPKVEAKQTQLKLKPGNEMTIECNIVQGNPTPTLSWKFKSVDDYTFNTVPSDATIDDNKLMIKSFEAKHKGDYQCVAMNIIGEHSVEINVVLQYAPNILDSDDTTIDVRTGDNVKLLCEVDAIPAATVRWELHKGESVVEFDSRHTTDDDNAHSFVATEADSGTYHCIAENDIGTAVKKTIVNVFVGPYIEPLAKEMRVETGSNITLRCDVSVGYPAPSTMWKFIALDSTATTLMSGTSSLSLKITKFTKSNEGLYLCIADNVVGNDRIRINIKLKN